MTDAPSRALKDLRDGLRTETLSIEGLITDLSACLDIISSGSVSVEITRRAIQRYLPSLQIQLLTHTVPNYLHALDEAQLEVIQAFFVPLRSSSTTIGRETLYIQRGIALTSYLTLPAFLNANPVPALPIPCRSFLLDVLDRLSNEYSIDEVYWAVWSDLGHGADGSEEKGRARGPQELLWEEATRSVVGIPAKCANAVGRWRSEAWPGDLPAGLIARPYFDRMIPRLERLMYELSLSPSPGAPDRIRLVIERFGSLGLLNTSPDVQSSRQPSFFVPFLPSLLAHLHPDPSSPLPPYSPSFLPSIFLPLPTSTLSTFVSCLLRHLSSRLEVGQLKPDTPNKSVHRAILVFGQIVGPAKVGEDAWEAVMRALLSQKSLSGSMDSEEHVRSRIIAGWVNSAGDGERRAFLELVSKAWTDPKSIKFSLYSQQFHLTHLLLLSISLFRQYDPLLVKLSHRPEFLMAIQSFLSHPDPKLRRLGMLVAEVLSERTIREENSNAPVQTEEEEMAELQAGFEAQEGSTGSERPPRTSKGPKRLKFDSGMWDGQGEGKEECRWLRSCLGVSDLDRKINEDSSGKAWLLGWDQMMVDKPTANHSSSPAARGRTSTTRTTRPQPSAKTKAKPKPKPKIVMLNEEQEADPLEGYAAESPSSSRSPSPTPSYLEEVAADPTLAMDASQAKKVSRPVYVQQLVALLKEREKPDHIEMGLKWGEGLVRAKRSFGTELSENSVNVAMVTLALNDPYHLDNFEETRQGLLNALVACAPRQVAPFLAEQYFNGQYSLQQKSVLLTSLAMGARELAGLSVPQPISTNRRIDFPTKVLPPALHQKYVGPNDLPRANFGNQLEEAIDGVRDLMLSKSARKGEETIPELARERKLRVGPNRTAKVAEVGSLADRNMTTGKAGQVVQSPIVPFKDVAAEYFIMPLVNRFWLHFQDSSVRESRAVATGDRYRGAGTGMILSPLALEKLLMTLSLLVHASRHSPLFLSVLAPEVMELGVTIGSRHLPSPSNNPMITDLDTAGLEEGSKTEAQVLAAALELVLVSLDVSVELDKGRTLAMDKAELVLAAGEWASGVFEIESKGGQVSGGQGGMREGRVRATAAGIVVKIAEIGEKWVAVGGRMR